MNTIPSRSPEPRPDPKPEPKYKVGDMLANNGEYYGTIVLIEGNYPCRFYGVRVKNYIGISMVRSQLLDNPEHYPNVIVIE